MSQFGHSRMSIPTEDVVLYSIIAFIVIENFIEIYLSRRQVSQLRENKEKDIFLQLELEVNHFSVSRIPLLWEEKVSRVGI